MSRKIVSGEGIRQYVQDLVSKDSLSMEDGWEGEVGLPQWNSPDDEGCNWHLNFARNARGHEATIKAAIESARQRFNLQR